MLTSGSSPSSATETRPAFLDYVCVAPIAVAATVNLWKVQSIRNILPLDLTLLAFLTTGVLLILSIASNPRPLVLGSPLLLLIASFLPGLALASFAHPYSTSKTLGLFVFVPFLALSALQLVNTPERREAFTQVISILGVAVAAGLEIQGTASVASPERIGLEDGNVIGLARMCSLAVVCLVLSRARGPRRVLHLAGAAVCLHAALTTGSRGPVVAALIALIVAMFANGQFMQARKIVRLAPAGLILLAFWVVADGTRLMTAYGGETDIVRVRLASTSLDLFTQHPMGIGWGDLVLHMPLGLREDAQGWVQYPHNILIEALTEGGILALLGLSYLLWRAFLPLGRLARAGDATPLSLLIAVTVSALTSSDLTGNRTVWVLVGIGLGAAQLGRAATRGNSLKKGVARVRTRAEFAPATTP